ncbi:glycosyl transferase family 1 [Skermanella stibiiresistens SB22]|uniref:Glycosyl transferase family 1 n=1 Tax=Skermanella stibiiresistens SB22 TaxID=1385369 RepID=W9GW36_9PROT|nr:glycosyltransferase family 4 protein [Skermanella stibiiresistens]EWY38105.1 glycosyl transferase family 1 [Skermanella stibiiresistens SB22]
MTADAVGGVWDYALELARGLALRGIRVTLAVMGPAPSPTQRAQATSVQGLDLRHGDFKLEWMEGAESDMAPAGDWLLDLADHVKPDVIHLNGYAHAALPWNKPVLVVGHSCVLSWWRAVHDAEAPTNWRPYADRVSAGLVAAGAVVAPTQAMLDALETHYGPIVNGKVIWNGRNSANWQARVEKEPSIISVGRIWDEAKNIRVLDGVAAELDWPVEVAGSWRSPNGGSTEDAPTANLRRLGQLGPEELADRYGRASIFALPARYEPFGLSILEAAMSGCALVLGDLPSLRELWTGAAVFVPPDEPATLSRELRRLIAEPDRLRGLATAARQRARGYGTERMVARYLDVYADLVDAPRPVTPHREIAAVPLGR